MAEPVPVIEADDSSSEKPGFVFHPGLSFVKGFSSCNSTLIPVYLARNGERNSHLR
jgi:hypothetical protein